jgi:hypothetical protein
VSHGLIHKHFVLYYSLAKREKRTFAAVSIVNLHVEKIGIIFCYVKMNNNHQAFLFKKKWTEKWIWKISA